jgi:hypothetical protein
MKIYLISFTVYLLFFNQYLILAQQNQNIPDSNTTNNFIYTNLENNSNSANLISRINMLYNLKKFTVFFKNNFTSNVTKLSDNFYRDYNDLKFITDYNVNDKFSSGAGIQYRTLSDNRNIEINKGKTGFYFADIKYKPVNNIFVDSKIGLKNEEQIGEKNMGISGELNSEISNLNFQDFIGEGKYHLSYDNLSQRTNYNIDLNTTINKQFSDRSFNTSIIKFYDLRSDFYIPATTSIKENYNIVNNIQSRVESYIYLQNNLQYLIDKDLKFQLLGNYTIKNITAGYKYKPGAENVVFENIYDTKVTENTFQASGNLEYSKKLLNAKLWITYSERTENHTTINTENIPNQYLYILNKIETDKNNNSRATSLIFESSFLPVNSHIFRFSLTSSILKYDTDSKDNYDDRDELNIISAVSHKYNNFYNFDVETIIEYNANTLNYLFKEKSSNNNTNKIYKLTTRSNFIPIKILTTKNLFQVLANYTVYKYEDLISQVQSFSFRQLFLSDTTNLIITKNITFDFFGNLKIYEQGEYNDENFSVRPIAYYDERRINPQLNFFLTNFIQISAGFRYFIQRQYYYVNGTKYLKRTYANYGPIGKFSVFMNKKAQINLTVSQEYIENSDNSVNSNSMNLLINILWNL